MSLAGRGAAVARKATRSAANQNYSPPPVYNPPVTPNSYGQYSRPSPPPMEQPGEIQPVAPSIEDFLGGDTGYQQQLRSFAQALESFNADVTKRRGSYDSDFGTSKKALEDQRGLDLKNMEADYGARGMMRSGLYGDAVNQYETEYGKRQTDLSSRYQQALDALTQEQGQYKSKQELESQASKEAAIRRRAEQYGI